MLELTVRPPWYFLQGCVSLLLVTGIGSSLTPYHPYLSQGTAVSACQTLGIVGGARAVLKGAALVCLLRPYWDSTDGTECRWVGRSLSGSPSLVGSSIVPADVYFAFL